MVCEECAFEAAMQKDGQPFHPHFCDWCGVAVELTPTGRVRKHDEPEDHPEWQTIQCDNRTYVNSSGHAACKGCDCQHKAVGSVEVLS